MDFRILCFTIWRKLNSHTFGNCHHRNFAESNTGLMNLTNRIKEAVSNVLFEDNRFKLLRSKRLNYGLQQIL